MKNYYRILGVKKDASEEEIREHWVELMRKLHPDQRIEGTTEDERIKEINEAYQVLKHSSTRVEYDLKRAYDQKKRGFYFRRLSIPIGIFAVLVVVGTIYLKKPQVTLQSVLLPKNPINQTNEIDDPNDLNELNVPNQIDPIDPRNTINPINEENPIDSKTQLTQRRNNPPDSKKQLAQQRIDLSMHQPRDAMTQQRSDPLASLNRKDQTDQIDQIDQINPTNPTDAPNDLNDPNDLNVVRIAASPPNRIDASTHLIATEEEVRQFFANYTDRYTQKDLDSFISLFSPRAIQNRQDGLEGIRKIYDNFLKQSTEVKYNMDNIRIEIYQNGVEVKARYELVQMLKKSGDKKIWRGNIRWSLIKEDGALKILSLDYQHQKSP